MTQPSSQTAYWWDEKHQRVVSHKFEIKEDLVIFLVPEAFTPVCTDTLRVASCANLRGVVAAVRDGAASVQEWVRKNQITIPVISLRTAADVSSFLLDSFVDEDERFRRVTLVREPEAWKMLSQSGESMEHVYSAYRGMKARTHG